MQAMRMLGPTMWDEVQQLGEYTMRTTILINLLAEVVRSKQG